MWLNQLCQRWMGRMGRTRSYRRRQRTQIRTRPRLALETLEDRITPSGQTAGSYDALVSDIQADTAANTNYVIDITNSFTFAAGGQVTISKLGAGSTLTIEGQNSANYTLTGNGNRLFFVGQGVNVLFKDLTITGGIASAANGDFPGGGGIDDAGGNVTLSNVAVEGNSVSGATASGGGIFV